MTFEVTAQRWGQRAAHVYRERDKYSFAEVTSFSNASLEFPIGIRCLKVHIGFVPFHAPRELSIAMKEMQEVGRITDCPRERQRQQTNRVYFKGKIFGDPAGHLGRSWIRLAIPVFHLGFM